MYRFANREMASRFDGGGVAGDFDADRLVKLNSIADSRSRRHCKNRWEEPLAVFEWRRNARPPSESQKKGPG